MEALSLWQIDCLLTEMEMLKSKINLKIIELECFPSSEPDKFGSRFIIIYADTLVTIEFAAALHFPSIVHVQWFNLKCV